MNNLEQIKKHKENIQEKIRILQGELDSLEIKEKDILTEIEITKKDACKEEYARGYENGYLKGYERGIMKGVNVAYINIAEKMKAKGFDHSLIAELVDLEKEEIEKI